MNLKARLQHAAITLPTHAGLCVAYSGGRDSTALLDALHQASLGPLRAAHVHHGLHPDADAWEEHCRTFCEQRGIDCRVERVQVTPAGEGPEAAARDARYAALAAQLREGEVLVTAHHAGDQAETVLFRIARGAGPAGAAGMAPLRPLASGWLWRPLLDLPRSALEAHCRRHGLQWIDDPQNDGGDNARSRLRPLLDGLEGIVPGARAALARHAALARQERSALDALADEALAGAIDDGWLDVSALRDRSQEAGAVLLRRWCARLGLPSPGQAWLDHARRTVLDARDDAQPELVLGEYTLSRYRQRLCFLKPPAPVPDGWHTDWDGGEPLELPGDAGRLTATAALPPGTQVRFPRPGERLQPAGSAHHRELKQIFQDAGVPPWERVRTPLLCLEGVPVQLGNRSLDGMKQWFQSSPVRWYAPRWHLGAT